MTTQYARSVTAKRLAECGMRCWEEQSRTNVRGSSSRRYCAKFLKVYQCGLSFVLGIEQVAAHTLEDSLCVEHFHDAAFSEAISGFCGVDCALGGAQFAGLEGGSLLICELVLLKSAFGGRDEFETALIEDSRGLRDGCGGFGDLSTASIPERNWDRDASAPAPKVRLILKLSKQGWLGQAEEMLVVELGFGCFYIALRLADSGMGA